jgi:FkbM family methyltransferase
MEGILSKAEHVLEVGARQVNYHLNALRFGFFFIRTRSFKMPARVNVAGTKVHLQYPPEHGVTADFFTCCIRNDYGLGRRLSKVRTIVDIGANVGFFSLAARSCYPQATIHAYEPNRRVIPFLKSNVESLGVNIYPEAVGAEAGMVSIVDTGDSNQARTAFDDNGGIPQVNLECAIERLGGAIDLLKLDCEGAEWDLFRSASPWKHVRNIRMEYHLLQRHTVQDVENALSRLGFEAIQWKCDLGFGTVWATSRH